MVSLTRIVLSIVLFSSIFGPDRTEAGGFAPRLARTPCQAHVARDERIECYSLIVPENRSVRNSRLIRIPVTILRSRSPHPDPDPVVYMEGGPGGATIRDMVSGKPIRFLDHRDFIAIEQRGSGWSIPALDCAEYSRALYRIGLENRTIADNPKPLLAAAATCAARFKARHVDLSGYNTQEISEDVNDLRIALHIPKINVYGISYSTRVFLELIRRHPDAVRSAVLDSTLPPDVLYDESALANVQRSIDRLFQNCQSRPSCRTAYPDLRARFQGLLTDLTQHPMAVKLADPVDGTPLAFPVNGRNVADAVTTGLLDPKVIPDLPRAIAQAAGGNLSGLMPLLQRSLRPGDYTWGMRFSVLCHDDAPFQDANRILAEDRSPLLAGLVAHDLPAGLCASWPSEASLRRPTAVHSNVPVLIFAGEYDPITPPSWGRRVHQSLPRSYFYEIRGRSHLAAIATPCGDAVAEAFFEDPRVAPPARCLDVVK